MKMTCDQHVDCIDVVPTSGYSADDAQPKAGKCDQRVLCPDPNLIVSNFSSEDPDRHIYYGAYYRGNLPPSIGGNTPIPVGCGVVGSSLNSPVEAIACGQRTSEECATGQTLPDPCQVCQPQSLGNTFGFFTPGTGNTCCDPSAPAGCCCDSPPNNPPQDPPDSGGVSPPTTPPPPGNTLYCNDAQDCVVDCGNGTLASGHVAACQYFATSKTYANRVAHSEACRRANEKLICWGDHGGGLNCEVFCIGTPTDYDLQATAKNGGDISFELVGGNLPAGLTMDESGHISGTATGAGGDAVAQIQMTDEDGNTATQTFCAVVMGITSSSLANGTVGTPYSDTVFATGGTPPRVFSALNLPAGLTIDSSGHITGTPTECGNLSPEIVVTDANGKSCGRELPIFINGVMSQPFSATLFCSSDPSLSVTIDGPAGLVCDPPGTSQMQVNNEAWSKAFTSANDELTALGCVCHLKGATTGAFPNQQDILPSTVLGCTVRLYTNTIPPTNIIDIVGGDPPFNFWNFYNANTGLFPHGTVTFRLFSAIGPIVFTQVYP